MKKTILLLLMVVGFFNCSNNIEFNNPALQGKTEGEIWKATSFRANVNENGELIITGTSNGSDDLTLRVPSTALITNRLGNTQSEAIFSNGANTIYSTNNNPDPDASLFEPDGQIEIYEFDTENNVVSGRFNFNAFDVSGFRTINFNEGDFYRVPVTGEAIDNSCNIANQLVTNTENAFNSTPTTDPNYSSVCNDYKNALTNKISACGDPDGSLQTLVDSLGDCTTDTSDPCGIATANANNAEAELNAVPNTDPQYPALCDDYKNALTNQITQCGDADGSIQMIIDSLGDCTISTSIPSGLISATVGTAAVTYETNITITPIGTTLAVSAEDDQTGSTISFTVEQNSIGVDIITDFMIEIGTGAGFALYVPTTNPMEVFTSEITTNNATTMDGTFSGTVQSTGAGPDFEISNGIIDIMY